MKTPSIKLLILSGLISLNLVFLPAPINAAPTTTDWNAPSGSNTTWSTASTGWSGGTSSGAAPVSGASGVEALFTNTAGLENTITIANTGVSSAGISFNNSATPSYAFNGGSLTLDIGSGDGSGGIVLSDLSNNTQTFNQNVILADSADTGNSLGVTYDITGAASGTATVDFAGGLTIGNAITTFGTTTGTGSNPNNLTITVGGAFVSTSTHSLSITLGGTSDTLNWDATSSYGTHAIDLKNFGTSSVTNIYTDPTAFVTIGGSTAVGGTTNLLTNGLTVNAAYSTGDTTATASQVLEVNLASAGSVNWAGAMALSPASSAGVTDTIQFDTANANNALTITPAITGATRSGALAVQITGLGTVVFGGANTYTAASTTVVGGTLVVQGGSTTASAVYQLGGSTANVIVNAGTALDYANTSTTASTNLNIGGTLTVGGASATTTLGGSIGKTGATSDEINVTGAATVTGTNLYVNVYGINGIAPTSGAYTLVAGGSGSSLNGATNNNLGNVYNAFNFTVATPTFNTASITVPVTAQTAQGTEYWVGGFSAANSVVGSSVWSISNGLATGGYSNWSTSSSGTAGSSGTGATSLTPGSGTTVNFTGISSTGGNNATSTTLGSNMAVAAINVSDAAGLGLNGDGYTLTIAGSGTNGITVSSGAGAVNLGATVAASASQTWTNSSSHVLTLSGLVQVANGTTLTLAGAGGTTFNGELAPTSGSVTVSSGAGAVTIASPVVTGGTNGSAFTLTNNSSNLTTVSGQVETGTSGYLTVAGSGNTTISNQITGGSTFGLIKNGAGTLTLSGANYYTGGTTITGGTLQADNAAALANPTGIASPTTIYGGGVLDLEGFSQTLGANILALGGGTGGGTIQSSSSNATLTTGGVTVASTGYTIASSATVSGPVTFNNISPTRASLNVAGTASGTVNVSTYATLSGTGTTGAVTLGGASSGINLVKSNSTTATLTVGGLTTTGSGVLTFALGTTLGAVDSITDSGTLVLGGSTTITIANLNNAASSSSISLVPTASSTSTNYLLLSSTGISGAGTLTLSTSTLDGDNLSLYQTGNNYYLEVASANNSVLTLPTTVLTLNERPSATGTVSTTVSNSSSTSSGTYSTSSSSSTLTLPSTGTVAAGSPGASSLSAGWSATTTVGSRSGTITISNTANSGDTGGNKSETVSGGIYAYAQPSYSTSPVAFGAVHEGATATGSVAITNPLNGNPAGYQDSLDSVSPTTTNTAVSASGFTGVTAGGTAQSVALSANTSSPGSLASTVNLGLYSDPTEATGLTGESITGTVTTTGLVYSGAGVWATNGGAAWGTPSVSQTTWTALGGVPGLAGAPYTNTDSASFGAGTGSVPLTANSGTAVVTLGGVNPNLNAITLNAANTGASYQIGSSSSDGTITLNGAGVGVATAAAAQVVNSAGNNTIAATLSLGTTYGANVNVSTGTQLALTGPVNGGGALYVSTGTGTTYLSNATGNGYTGGTTVSAGTVYVDNSSNSGTGTGAVTVQSGGTVAGSGAISTSSGASINNGGTLASGDAQTRGSAIANITTNPGLVFNNTAVTVGTVSGTNTGGATLAFALASNSTPGTGYYSFTNPSLNSTYMTLTSGSTLSFALNSTDTVALTDLTSSATLQLRSPTFVPYLLVSGNQTAFNGANLLTVSGGGSAAVYSIDGTGYVVGVLTTAGYNDASAFTGSNSASFSLTGDDGVYYNPITITIAQAPSTPVYPDPTLYYQSGVGLEVVPEPGTWALMLGGLALLIVIQRRRNKLS